MHGSGTSITRRRALTGAVGAASGAFAGCGTVVSGRDSGRERPVSILAAGSLNNALEFGLSRAIDSRLRIEAHGSAQIARLVAEGQKSPDIVALADPELLESPLGVRWYTTFASNALVVAYNRQTPGGRRIAAGGRERWYEPVLTGDATLGRTDPDLDPLGYRTLFMLELATRYYGTETALRDRIPSTDQVYPETQLVGQLETGAVDGAVTYRSMAEERGYDYVDLPSRIDFSDRRFADDWYAGVSYTLPDGSTVRGDVIRYAATMLTNRPAAASVFRTLVASEYLREHGFVLANDHPRQVGDVPARVRT